MPESETFGFLHLTDLHYGQSGQGPLWPNVREAFFEDLRRLHERCGPWQAVLFTGDFVFSGKDDELKGMEADVLRRLWKELKALGSGDAVLLGVPGNHDLARPDAKKPSAALRQLLRRDGFAEIEEEFWGQPGNEYRSVMDTALASYKSWWTRTPFRRDALIVDGLLPGDFSTTLSVGSRRIGVVGLNTTFLQLAGGDYTGRLAWDLRQLQAVCGPDLADWLAAHDVCLLLTHQGPEWLDGRSRTMYPEINPAGRFAVHLFGHMHETVVRALSQGGGRPLRQWQGNSLFGLEHFGDPPRKDRRHGYGAGRIEFGLAEAVLRFWPRNATCDANGWRFIPDHASCVLREEDGGTAPESIPIARRSPSPRRRAKTAAAVPDRAEQALVSLYAKAARDLWDIIDLAGLPEDDRHLAMQRFMLRQLYLPLRMFIERATKEGAFAALEEQRDRQRLAAAGRIAVEDRKQPKRQSVGAWLRSSARRKKAASRLVILGDPGGGKTTLLRWLATAYLLRHERDPDFERLPDVGSLPEVDWLPILIRCRELDRARLRQGTLEDLLRQTLAKMELPGGQLEALVDLLRSRLETGRALLFVDGLDEIVDPGLRAAFCERLEAVARRFPAAPFIATSRVVGYREMHRRLGEGFAHGTLTELSPREKDDFIRRWCEVTITDPSRREGEAEKLLRGIHGSDRIERLTTNPMLLTTMALVQRKVGKLPTRRHKLYWEAVGVLLNWRAEVENPMDLDEALPQLEYLAYAMCDRGVQRLRRDEVLQLLEDVRRDYPNIRPIQRQAPESFLGQLERRTGLLAEVGEVVHAGKPVPVYEFRHLTFQEYLAALAILEGRFPGHQPGTTLAQRVKPLAGRIAEVEQEFSEPEPLVTENWREALRLCVASCNDDDVDPVLEAILGPERPEEARPRAILAVLCLADEPNVGQAQADAILRRFAEQVSGVDGSGNIRTGVDQAAMEAASSVWNELLSTVLAEEFLRRNEARAQPGGLSGMVSTNNLTANKNGRCEWMTRQVAMLGSSSEIDIIRSSLAIMEAAFESKALAIPGLIDQLIALIGRNPAVSHAASWALSWLRARKIWKPTPKDLSPLLEHLANANLDPEARRWLVDIAKLRRITASELKEGPT
jgi:hypothetical protein